MARKFYQPGWLLALAILVICPGAHAALKGLQGHVPAVTGHLLPVGRLAATNQLDLAIGLPLRNQAALNSLLHELYDPASTNFHRYLTPEQFAARFGPTEQDYQSVIEFARTNGFTVTHTHANRVLLDVNGRVQDIEKAFHITMRTYRHPTEARNFYAPDAEPSVADGLQVLDISGLSDYARAKQFLHAQPAGGQALPAAGSAPGGAYMGQDFRTAYAPGASFNGFGQMVGLVEFSGYDPDDIFAYEGLAGLPNVPLQNVLLDGSIGDIVAVPDVESEVCLDIEMAMSMATNLAEVVVFEAPYNNSAGEFNDVLNAMAASSQIKQFSCSWGFAESPDRTADQIFQQMAAQGQSFFQASGDGDAWTSPIWEPAESTNITVVGGTTLSMNGTGGSYSSEKAWNAGNLGSSSGANGSTNDYWGTGGGVSANYAIPYWQVGVNMTNNLGSTSMRNIPDVALTADNVYVTHGSGRNGIYGGTSCAAPLWAGFMAMVNQQASEIVTSPAGFVNPAIYALGDGTNYLACFHDITMGSNAWPGSPDLYFAVPGYDLCTGWGTPDGTNLIYALAGGGPDLLVISPLGGGAASGAVGGPFNGSVQTFGLNNVSAGEMSWSLINTSAWLAVSQLSGTLAAGDQTDVTVSLTSAANILPAGDYSATIFFTNLTTHVAQPRNFTLQAGQSLVQDGGFESGSFCHWTLAGRTTSDFGTNIWNGVESSHPGYNPVHSGNYGALLGDSPMAVLYQTVATVPGQKYLLTFWVINPVGGAPINNHIEQFEVNWNTNAVTNTVYYVQNPAAFTWTNFHFVVAATTSNATLQFGAQNQPDYFGLDDVTVTAIPTPSVSAITTASNGLAFTWNTLPNVGYLVQYKTNLLQANWLNLGGSITAVTNTLTLIDTNAFYASQQRFYRVSISP